MVFSCVLISYICVCMYIALLSACSYRTYVCMLGREEAVKRIGGGVGKKRQKGGEVCVGMHPKNRENAGVGVVLGCATVT